MSCLISMKTYSILHCYGFFLFIPQVAFILLSFRSCIMTGLGPGPLRLAGSGFTRTPRDRRALTISLKLSEQSELGQECIVQDCDTDYLLNTLCPESYTMSQLHGEETKVSAMECHCQDNANSRKLQEHSTCMTDLINLMLRKLTLHTLGFNHFYWLSWLKVQPTWQEPLWLIRVRMQFHLPCDSAIAH